MASVTDTLARDWFGGSVEALELWVKRFAELRPHPLKLKDTLQGIHGRTFGPELSNWLDVFERYEMEVADPGEAELKAPGETVGLISLVEARGPAWIAEFAGAFTASTVVVQQDALSYLVSLAGTPSGVCRVYYFHPDDWGLWPTDPSLSARLYRTLADDDRRTGENLWFTSSETARYAEGLGHFEALVKPETLPEAWDPQRLWPRVDWLIHTFLGIGQDWSGQLSRAASFEVWAEEAEEVKACPHLAAYWLWSHWFFENRETLAQLQKQLAGAVDPLVVESLELIEALDKNARVQVGQRDATAFSALKARFVEEAPMAVFEPATQDRVRTRRTVWLTASEDESAATQALSSAAENEPLVREALLLFDHLGQGGAMAPGPAPIHGGLDLDNAMDRLAELMDDRFEPLVRARLERSLAVEDTHTDAGYGLILAWAALFDDLDAFEAPFVRLGTQRLGTRRMRELYRAYGRFDDPRSIKTLARGAQAWVREMDDWIRMTPDEPVLQLLKKDTLATHRLIAVVLERAQFSAANWEVAVAAAVAAGQLRSTQALKGLRRAVESRLGRLEDGSQARVVRALYEVDGTGSLPFLRSLFDWALDEWESSDDDDDAEGLQKDLACYLVGLLPMAPEEPRFQAVAKQLLSLFLLKLGPRRTPRRDLIAAASAVLSGIRDGEVRSLAGSVAPYRRVSFKETASTQVAAADLRALAETVERELTA